MVEAFPVAPKVFWRWRPLRLATHHQQYPTTGLQMWMLAKIPSARHPIRLYDARFLSQYTSSWVWHPRYGRISVPIQAVPLPRRPWSISWGACVDHLVHHICLPTGVSASQTVGSSSLCICASPQNCLYVYPTIMRVLRTVPFSMHRTAAILVLCFQIYSRIHPLLSIHHMSAVLVLLLSRNAVIWSSCCNSGLSLRAIDSATNLLLRLNTKCRRFHAPTRFSHLQLYLPNPSLTQLSCKYNLTHRRALVQCSALLQLGLAGLLRIVTSSWISSFASSGWWLHSYQWPSLFLTMRDRVVVIDNLYHFKVCLCARTFNIKHYPLEPPHGKNLLLVCHS